MSSPPFLFLHTHTHISIQKYSIHTVDIHTYVCIYVYTVRPLLGTLCDVNFSPYHRGFLNSEVKYNTDTEWCPHHRRVHSSEVCNRGFPCIPSSYTNTVFLSIYACTNTQELFKVRTYVRLYSLNKLDCTY